MPDVFISYSTQDEKIARFMYDHLQKEGIAVFLASASLDPGQNWSNEILNNLSSSPWVLFLASRAACQSPYVQQELGAALITQKNLVPVVWDMNPSELPGWANQKQALNLTGASIEKVRQEISKIAETIKADKVKGAIIIGGLIFALFLLASKQ